MGSSLKYGPFRGSLEGCRTIFGDPKTGTLILETSIFCMYMDTSGRTPGQAMKGFGLREPIPKFRPETTKPSTLHPKITANPDTCKLEHKRVVRASCKLLFSGKAAQSIKIQSPSTPHNNTHTHTHQNKHTHTQRHTHTHHPQKTVQSQEPSTINLNPKP